MRQGHGVRPWRLVYSQPVLPRSGSPIGLECPALVLRGASPCLGLWVWGLSGNAL
jgi:hypothetical protein